MAIRIGNRDYEESSPIFRNIPRIETGFDLDVLQSAGIYFVQDPANGPDVGMWFVMVFGSVDQNNRRRVGQYAFEGLGPRTYQRTRQVDGWTSWTRVGVGPDEGTNLGVLVVDDAVTVTSDTGLDAEIPLAGSAGAGVMSRADKIKLDTIQAGAQVNPTTADNLAALLTVDGTGSGLDADLLDGNHASAFAAAIHAHGSATGSDAGFMSAADKTKLDAIEPGAQVNPSAADIMAAVLSLDGPSSGLNAQFLQGADLDDLAAAFASAGHGHPVAESSSDGFMSAGDKTKLNGIQSGAQVNPSASALLASLLGVDGETSLLDADLLDGKHATAFLSAEKVANSHIVPIDKTSTANTASVSFQVGASARARAGLIGDDDLSIDVSPDGATWHEAIVIDKDTGEVSFPNTLIGGGGGGGGLAVLPGYIYGLELSNSVVDATNELVIAAGTAADIGGAAMITLASSITKRLDAVWAAGTNQGGLSTGTKANGTTYFVYVIRNSTTEAVDVLFDVSPAAPTMPSGFDQRALIGAIITTSAGEIRPFVQVGDVVTWTAFTHDYNNTALSTTAVLASLASGGVPSVPLGVVVEVTLQMGSSAGSARYIQISSPLVSDQAPLSVGTTASGFNQANTTNVGQWRGLTNTSGQVRVRSNNSSTTCNFNVLSWRFPRR